MRNHRRALLGATLFAAFASASPAAAQRVDRIVAFGDSYADDGNAFQLAGIAPPIIYSTGRFSGGVNYIDVLSKLLNAPVQNFAIGGARTNTLNQTPGLPGFTSEVQFFLAGGGPAAFPQVTPTFDENDLVTISIGGNDARAYQQGGGTVAGAATAAATAVGFADAGIDLLVNAGAPTISFLAGDTSRLPEVNFYADPAGARAVRQAYSSAFNTGIQNALADHAANGVMVHYLDLTAVLNNIEANLAAYGFSGLACPAFPPPAGPGVPGSTACIDQTTANKYVFYGDQLHLTSAGFTVVAQYVAAQLNAPLVLQAPSDLGHATARQFGRTLSSRADLYGPRAAEPGAGARFFAVGDFFQRDVPDSDDTENFDIDGVGGTIGAEFGFGGGIVGIAGNYSRPRVRFGNQTARINARSWQVGAYAAMGDANLFAQGYAGYGKDRNRITRAAIIDDMSGRASGSHVTAGFKGGYLMPFSVLRVGPVVALDYAKAKVDGYTENGDAALTLDVRSQSLKSVTGQIGLEARGDFDSGGLALRPHFAATLEHDFSGDSRLLRFSQTSAPVIVNQWEIAGDKQTYGRVSGGASAQLMGAASLDVALSSTIGRDGGNEVGGNVGLRVGF